MRKEIFRNIRRFSTDTEINEIQHFQRLSKEWWDESGPLKGLHSMNKVRIPLIQDGLLSRHGPPLSPSLPLANKEILDIGCGGGFLSEPLAKLGAKVIGLDPTAAQIDVAKFRVRENNLQNLDYVCTTIQQHSEVNKEKYDAVVLSEVLEHITDKEEFLEASLKCLKPQGSIFVTTMSKTLSCAFYGIFLAEYVLKCIPKGTHQYDKFITSQQLKKMLQDQGCETLLAKGWYYIPYRNTWVQTKHTNLLYGVHAVKSK